MPFQASSQEIDFDLVATYFKALSNPVRLELLWRLRTPQAAADVEVRPRRRDELRPGRAVARQTVLEHIEQMERVGIVRVVEEGDGRAARWLTDVPNLFALVEEMRKLTAIPPHELLEFEKTTTMSHTDESVWPSGPKLVVLGGPWRGKAFLLRGAGPWSVGRSRSAQVSLQYDPFVSARHAVVRRADEGFEVAAAEASSNPTQVNLVTVPQAGRRLRHGDLVGAGQSLLLFHEE